MSHVHVHVTCACACDMHVHVRACCMCMCACMCACACVGTGVQLETPGEPSLPSRVYCLELFRSLLRLTPTTVEARPHEFISRGCCAVSPLRLQLRSTASRVHDCPPSVPSLQHSNETGGYTTAFETDGCTSQQPRSDNPHPRLAPTSLCLPGNPLRQLPSPRTRAPRSAALARLRPRTPSAAAAHAHTAATETEPLMQLRPRLCLADLPLR